MSQLWGTLSLQCCLLWPVWSPLEWHTCPVRREPPVAPQHLSFSSGLPPPLGGCRTTSGAEGALRYPDVSTGGVRRVDRGTREGLRTPPVPSWQAASPLPPQDM